MPLDMIPIPIDPLVVVVARADTRSHGERESRALTAIKLALLQEQSRGLGCTDLRGSRLECRTCRVAECPFGHHPGV